MPDSDALDLLLVEIRKTIKENKVFLEKLGDETPDEIEAEPDESVAPDETYEEL